jgi:hypothetical protein
VSDRALELRLRAAAGALDESAPAFDPARLSPARRSRPRWAVVAAAVAVVAVASAPAAISAFGRLLDVGTVEELGPVRADVAPPYLGERVQIADAQGLLPFRIRTLADLAAPDWVYVRSDFAGGMATVPYGRMLLTQWPLDTVRARVEVAPEGTADEVAAGRLHAIWFAGAARGTLTVLGADGTAHHETFEVADGALFWEADGMAFLLQGTTSKADAARLGTRLR